MSKQLDKLKASMQRVEAQNRIKGRNGKWKRRNVNTVDWNDHNETDASYYQPSI